MSCFQQFKRTDIFCIPISASRQVCTAIQDGESCVRVLYRSNSEMKHSSTSL